MNGENKSRLEEALKDAARAAEFIYELDYDKRATFTAFLLGYIDRMKEEEET